MSDNHGTVRELVWSDLCPWLILIRAVRIAVSPRVLLLAAARGCLPSPPVGAALD